MAGQICPACGYPTIGSGMCAACRPVAVPAEDEATWRKDWANATAAAKPLPPVAHPSAAQAV